MKYAFVLTAIAAIASKVAAVGVSGTPEGFASSATGGGNATPVYPTSTDELGSYLGDDEARVIGLAKTFDFTDTEGSTTTSGCTPWGTGSACQVAINKDDWCTNYEPDAATTTVTYKNAGMLGITVGSNKSLIGEGTTGVIKGRGLRIVNGVKNVIVQNIAVTDINPQYVWGGDAITINQADLVWLDHITTDLSHLDCSHWSSALRPGTEADNRVSITNNYINGESDYSATCDGHHYWNVYLDGSSDKVTFKGNYLYKTSGRAPKVQDNTYLHAVNNYWDENSGHAFEIGTGGVPFLRRVTTSLNVNRGSSSHPPSRVPSSPPTPTPAPAPPLSVASCVVNVNGGTLDRHFRLTFWSVFKGETLPLSAVASTVPPWQPPAQGNL
uniref:pectin lyase n=1 Tax=Penicillium griseoroseum TaxID=84562 RepID=Q8NKE3_PENGR|nr:pectin lyase [Penicillium griseoroseum]